MSSDQGAWSKEGAISRRYGPSILASLRVYIYIYVVCAVDVFVT